MITEREIRVGNWIKTPSISHPVGVIPSDIVTISQLSQHQIEAGYEGIPLTSELLKLNQFSYYASDSEWQPEYYLKIWIEDHNETFALTPVKGIINGMVSEVGFRFIMYHEETSHMRPTAIIKYVHELQNLVYALYKIELKINL